MQKIVYIALIGLLVSSCSGIRKTAVTMDASSGVREVSLTSVEENNLTNGNFNIARADIEIRSSEGKTNLLASIRYRTNNTYLLSIRSKTGIEAVRIYISEDTIMANDRIHRKFYFGSTKYLEDKYGISFNLVPALFGDIVSDGNETPVTIKCRQGNAFLKTGSEGNHVEYRIDCGQAKAGYTEIFKGPDAENIIMKFDRFNRHDRSVYPSQIDITHTSGEIEIGIMIKRMEIPAEGEITFIPGNNYEKVELR
jgi:predicted 3-demethylubiquinone-9 3-methyltransferase (glyoxalase superfamily)